MIVFYNPKSRTVKNAIETKLRILEDFRIVNDDNREYARRKFTDAIYNYANLDPYGTIERIAKSIIINGLN